MLLHWTFYMYLSTSLHAFMADTLLMEPYPLPQIDYIFIKCLYPLVFYKQKPCLGPGTLFRGFKEMKIRHAQRYTYNEVKVR